MNIVSGRIRLGLSAAAAAGAFLLAFVPVTAAHAASTIHFKYTLSDSFTDTSCGFPITVNFQGNGVFTWFFDAQGNFQRQITEWNAVVADSANGITLTETDHWVEFTNSDMDVYKMTGLPIHIHDGGVVIRDAGYVLFNPDGSVAVIHGPHPQFEGDLGALCAAFS